MSDPTPPRRTRSPRGHGAQLRAEIVEAAAALLDEHGIEQAVTLRAVARRVGIAAPSIYAHFPTREHVVVAVVSEAFDALEAHIGAAAEAAGRDPQDRLRAASHAYVDFAARWPQRYRAMFSGVWIPDEPSSSPEADGPPRLVVGDEAFTVLVTAIRDCAAEGTSASTDPFADATALWTALHGLAELRPAAPRFPWPDGLLDVLVDRLALLTR
ncbi:TetR/AcrR family transcriptional regulator [Cellulomonas sp. P5_C5]